MRKILLTFVLACFLAQPAYAIVNPLEVANNKVGVHILAPEEISAAAKLVNTTGGDWGYVTIPMRSNDRDRDKWQNFFTKARELHVIPIIRLATYPENANWVSPDVYDLIDFANFLNDMPWPTKNRYVVLFNEPNHSNEWGGQVNPFEYATLVVNAKQIFKTRSEDFFLLAGGLDMSVPNSKTSMDALQFFTLMTKLQPEWYASIDGLASHAYPNPGFSASPYTTNRYGITSFRHEQQHLAKLGLSGKPVFITETGTITGGTFYEPAFKEIWTDANLVTVTPFVLFAGSSDFEKFSLLDNSHNPKKTYQDIVGLQKIAGSPLLSNIAISSTEGFKTQDQPQSKPLFTWDKITDLLNTISGKKEMTIGNITITVEVRDTPGEREMGLSGRPSLPDNHGMLFVFPTAGKHTFWMKDMKFALDFIWIRDGRVVELSENIPPPAETNNTPQVITPVEAIDSIVEVPAGFAAKNNIKVGDPIAQ